MLPYCGQLLLSDSDSPQKWNPSCNLMSLALLKNLNVNFVLDASAQRSSVPHLALYY